MSLLDLAYRISHGYPGKVPALAARFEINVGTLQNKLNPNFPSNSLNIDEFEQIADMADANRRVADFFAKKAGCVVFQLAESGCSDLELLDSFMLVLKALGKFSDEFQRDFADGNISQVEFDRIVNESDDVITTLLELRGRIGQMVTR